MPERPVANHHHYHHHHHDADAAPLPEHALLGGARVRWTGRAEGDLAEPGPLGDERRRRVVDRSWTVLRQVHGNAVAVVRAPGGCSGREADAAVTDRREAALAVLTADCAPVALASDEGVIGVAHAGWRGLVAGVVDATVEAMRSLGAGRISAAIGPCIRTACYTFGSGDLEAVVEAAGPKARGTDARGRPAVDLAAAVSAELRRAGVDHPFDVEVCTACSKGHWSHRASRDRARQATVVWCP